jgi:CheY-like chemotaxis protein
MKVLLADHEPMWQEFVCARLQARGLEVISVVSGERAWSVLEEKHAPRLAIIERRLPTLSGLEICRRLRARDDAFYTYVLLLIPVAHRLEQLVALESGADDCLSKPFNEDELIARLAIAQRVLDVDRRLTAINGRWRTLLDNMPFGVVTIDGNGMMKRMNTTFASHMGYAEVRDLLGHPVSRMFRRHSDIHGLLEQVRWADAFDAVEVQCQGANGKLPCLRLWGRPLPPNDEATYEIITQQLT